jgi:hypothetical protein
LWVRFNFPCDRSIQQRLLKIFRQEIKDWENRNLVKGAILTYHFKTPSVPGDSLYVCLDIPAVKTPYERSVQLPEETISQIPSRIINKITQVCNENLVKLDIIMDYEFDVASSRECAIKAGKSYYRNAPTEEIIRFASTGTKIALNLFDMIENQEITLTNHEKLAGDILSRLKEELGDNYFWLREAFHFVCNPMLFDDAYLWSLTAS